MTKWFTGKWANGLQQSKHSSRLMDAPFVSFYKNHSLLNSFKNIFTLPLSFELSVLLFTSTINCEFFSNEYITEDLLDFPHPNHHHQCLIHAKIIYICSNNPFLSASWFKISNFESLASTIPTCHTANNSHHWTLFGNFFPFLVSSRKSNISTRLTNLVKTLSILVSLSFRRIYQGFSFCLHAELACFDFLFHCSVFALLTILFFISLYLYERVIHSFATYVLRIIFLLFVQSIIKSSLVRQHLFNFTISNVLWKWET